MSTSFLRRFVGVVGDLETDRLGFGGVASTAAGIAQVLFFVFLVVFVIALVMGLISRRSPPPI